MSFDHIKSSLEQIKELAKVVSDLPHSLDSLLLWEKNKHEQQKVQAIQEVQNKQEVLKNSIEETKMVSTLARYVRNILSDDEINSFDNLFLGDSVEDFILVYLQEQQYIKNEEKKWNLIPQQALQKAFDIYDPTSNIQSTLEEISTYYVLQEGKSKYKKVAEHFEQLLGQKNSLVQKKEELQIHTTQTRIQKKPNPDLLRYDQEEKRLKKVGLAYDINDEQDPQMKTPQYILNRFVSSWYSLNPKTWVTQCARTTRLDAKRLFHKTLPQGNAFDVMRSEQGWFKTSLVSELYNTKEKSKSKVDSIVPNKDLGKNKHINSLVWYKSNIADLFVTSSTKNGKKYGHRALMFRLAEQWYVLDPYTAIQPWENKNKPRTLESYTKSMQTGKNKREFMRMNFYEAPINLDSASLV